eukprot:jgi/Mesvir1/1547/Mv14530-RA.1
MSASILPYRAACAAWATTTTTRAACCHERTVLQTSIPLTYGGLNLAGCRNRKTHYRLKSLAVPGGQAFLELSPPGSVSTFKRSRPARSRTIAFAKSAPVVEFPKDYNEVISQAEAAVRAAISDGKLLLEIEFPTAGLNTTAGDGEGGNEMTTSMELLRRFCGVFVRMNMAKNTRVYFPDIKECASAKKSVFKDSPFQVDYLTKPSGLNDFGISPSDAKVTERVSADDQAFVAAYPYFNVDEMLAIQDIYNARIAGTSRPLIVFNGELDRIRSGYYPSFFYPKLGKLAKAFLPNFDQAYYIHNFKGTSGGILFRAYPGPWQVLRRDSVGNIVCVHTQETMPSLKEVALNILRG